MEYFNAQGILEEQGIVPGMSVALPYGLVLTLEPPFDLGRFCNNEEQLQALQSLVGLCQGVVVYISELNIPLAALIIVANIHLGVIYTIRDVGLLSKLKKINPALSIENLYEQIISKTGVMQALQSVGVESSLTFIPFEEIPNFYAEIANSGIIEESIMNYQSTMYSSMSGLDELISSSMLGGFSG